MKVLLITPSPPAKSVQPFLIATLQHTGDWQKMSEQEHDDLLNRGVIYDTEPGRALAKSFGMAHEIVATIAPSSATKN